jgi:hypothetical protein
MGSVRQSLIFIFEIYVAPEALHCCKWRHFLGVTLYDIIFRLSIPEGVKQCIPRFQSFLCGFPFAVHAGVPSLGARRLSGRRAVSSTRGAGGSAVSSPRSPRNCGIARHRRWPPPLVRPQRPPASHGCRDSTSVDRIKGYASEHFRTHAQEQA